MDTVVDRIRDARARLGKSEHDVIGRVIQPGDRGAYFLGKGTYELYHAIGATVRPTSLLEIGVRYGYSLYALALGSGRVGRVRGFDGEFDDPGSCAVARYNVRLIVPDVLIGLLDTQVIDALPAMLPVDLAHVDGRHTAAGCRHDCELVYPHVRPGGVILVDDARGEVRDGADRFCRDRGLTPHHLPCFTDMYVIPVPGQPQPRHPFTTDYDGYRP